MADNQSSPRVISTRQGQVEYAEWGEGPAVLALHGAMGGYDQSLLLARTIGAAGFRYLGVSRPGYLGTPLASGKSPEAQADLCAALLDALGIETVVVMAVSGGGPCAMHFALRHRQRCRGLVLVSTCGQRMTEDVPFSFKLTGLLVRIPAIANAVQRKARANLELAAARSIPAPELRACTLQDAETGPLFMELLTSTSDRMAQRMPGTWNDIAITRTATYPLEQIAVPTVIVHGTQDRMVSYTRHAVTLAGRIPGAELLTLEGGDHVAIYTHRREAQARVACFLREHAG